MVIVNSDSVFKKYRALFVGIFVFLIILGILFFLLLRKNIVFDVSDSVDDIVEVGSNYEPVVISACYGNKLKCNSIDVEIINGVDTKILGSYKVEYVAYYKKHKKTYVRNVNVVDRQNPEISVESDVLSVCPNVDNYDVKYSAYDNYDGDLTEKVSKQIVDDNLVLFVSDSSDNSYSKNVQIKREDIENPSLILYGNTVMYIPLNSFYSEPGYEAYDNCDGDITGSVSVDGSVNTAASGTYTINYSVSDSTGNSISASRSVNVYAPNGNGSKVIYLTFDDGPSAYTGELLGILAKYNVKATFFVTGVKSDYSYYIKQAYDQGHSIALHTYSHNYSSVYSGVDAYFNDLNAINELVKSQTGSYSTLIRFPGGSSNTVSKNYSNGIMSTLARMVEEKGYKYFDWNVSSGDASGTVMSSEVYANNVINGLGSGSYYIVLQHDTNINSIRAVGIIIEYGLSHGYSFKALDMGSPVVHHRIAN